MAHTILTMIGPDRPGLVQRVSEALAASGGNWLESRMARLAGQFAGIVLVDAPEAFLARLPALAEAGLHITATPAGAPPAEAQGGVRLRLEATAQDRPGIVQEVTHAVARQGGNIEEMTTTVANAAFSGEAMFSAAIILTLPEARVAALAESLEDLSNDMVVDIARD